MVYRILLLALTFIVSCRPKCNYEIISVRENTPTFVATIYASDTIWTEMEIFAKSLANQKKDKKYKSYTIGFYSDKNKTPKFNAEGIPIVKSYEEASHAQDFLIATYEIMADDPTSETFEH